MPVELFSYLVLERGKINAKETVECDKLNCNLRGLCDHIVYNVTCLYCI